jgi:hypothetical protein
MAYRNGTYVAFHAGGTPNQSASDIKYYRALQMWSANSSIEFDFVNSHDKTAAVRDTSLHSTLRSRLLERLRNSKNFVLIITEATRLDNDWVPFEIAAAIDTYDLPVIAAYPGLDAVLNPLELRPLWPEALKVRIDAEEASVIHIPFRQQPILDSISRFNPTDHPPGSLCHYSRAAYQQWGYI